MRLFGTSRFFPMKAKPKIDDVPRISQAVREVEQKLGDKGRGLVRYSVTERLCRVIVEGPGQETITAYGHAISD